MRYRANTAVLGAYLKLLSDEKSGRNFLLVIRESWIVSFGENVHFRISLREMPKMPRRDAKKRRKKFASHCVP